MDVHPETVHRRGLIVAPVLKDLAYTDLLFKWIPICTIVLALHVIVVEISWIYVGISLNLDGCQHKLDFLLFCAQFVYLCLLNIQILSMLEVVVDIPVVGIWWVILSNDFKM